MATPLGEFLVARRRELGIDRKMLAASSGLSYPYISQLETSEDKRPSEKVLRLLAPALELELDVLLEVAQGWTSGSLTTAPPRTRPVAAFTSTPDRSGRTSHEDLVARLERARPRRRPADADELVAELAQRLGEHSPETQLAVLLELQARALEELQQR